jgi:hypothetical protein
MGIVIAKFLLANDTVSDSPSDRQGWARFFLCFLRYLLWGCVVLLRLALTLVLLHSAITGILFIVS